MSKRELNWFGWSIQTIAAVYETDQACREYEAGLVNIDYVWTAANAEGYERSLDANSI